MSGAKRNMISGLPAMSMIQSAQRRFDEPPEQGQPDEEVEMPFFGQAEPEEGASSSRVDEVRRKHEGDLLRIDGVEGVSIESDEIGEDVIVVFVRDESVVRKIPGSLDGVPVRAEVTGEFDALLPEASVESSEPVPSVGKSEPKAESKKPRKATASESKPRAKQKPASLLDPALQTAKPEKTSKPTASRTRSKAGAKPQPAKGRKAKPRSPR